MSADPCTLLEQAVAVAARVFAGEQVSTAEREMSLAILRRVPVAGAARARLVVTRTPGRCASRSTPDVTGDELLAEDAALRGVTP